MKKLLFILALLCAPLASAQTYPVTYNTGGNITATNASCVPTACVGIGLPSPAAAVITVGITGTFSATLAVEESQNGINFTSAGTSLTSTGTTSYVIAGFTQFRVRASAYSSGNAGVNFQVSNAPSGGVTSGTADPTGNSCAANQLYVQTTTGNLYSCDAGVFAKVGGSGGTVTAVTGTAPIVSSGGTTPAISCATCNTSAAAITNNVLAKGSGGAQGLANSTITDAGLGVTVGSPTGGAEGAGTLNATGLFVNGAAPLTSITLPQTVGGTVNSGGIPYFNSATSMSSSAALTSGCVVKGGGAGVAPSCSSITDNGSNISTSENFNAGNLLINNDNILGQAGTGILLVEASGFNPLVRMSFSADATTSPALCPSGTGLKLGQGGATCTTLTQFTAGSFSVAGLTPSAATGALSVPQETGFISCTQATCASTPTTLFTVGANTVLITIKAAVSCTGSTSTATAILAVNYTDPSGTAQTITAPTAICTTLGASSVSQITQTINAENATTVQYKVTAANTPNYQARVAVFQESLQ